MQRNETSKTAWVQSALDRFEGRLVRYATGFTGNVDLARDVVQDTFMRLCAADPAEVDEHLAAWLYTVCRNRALDLKRKERHMVPWSAVMTDQAVDAAPPPSAVAERHETENDVARALRALPENQQEVIRLKFQDALSYKEISEITGLSVSNVGYLIHTGIKTLRQRFASQPGLPEQA